MMVNLRENLPILFETKHIWVFHTYVYNFFVEIHLETESTTKYQDLLWFIYKKSFSPKMTSLRTRGCLPYDWALHDSQLARVDWASIGLHSLTENASLLFLSHSPGILRNPTLSRHIFWQRRRLPTRSSSPRSDQASPGHQRIGVSPIHGVSPREETLDVAAI
jgi:hypothetical protein